ncbi:hypothetical protein CHUAL_000351 [Chamberlinius hualienensis]
MDDIFNSTCDLATTLNELVNDVNDVNEWPFIPESNMTTIELIKNMGYKAELHEFTTADGYIIEIQRILPTNKSYSSFQRQRLPVILQHGILSASSSWVLNFPEQSLGFMLADAGFDVWLSNVRGGPYGRKHITLDPKSKKFWDFSFEEMAIYDIAGAIDYVLNVTNHTQVNYIGHSMGTTLGFVLLSQLKQYNNKIKVFYALAPAVYLHHMKSILFRLFIHFETVIEKVMSILSYYWFPPSDDYSPNEDKYCHPNSTFCMALISELVGPNIKQLNRTRISVYIHQSLKITSTRAFHHYAQVYNSEKFRRFDWGIFENLRKYWRLSPPEYPLESITTPTIFFCGRNDYITSLEDIFQTSQRLPYHLQTFYAQDPEWNHLDFVTTFNGTIINQPLIDMMTRLDNEKQLPFIEVEMATTYVTDKSIGVVECRRAFRPLLYLLFACGFDYNLNPHFCRRVLTYVFRVVTILIFGSYFVIYIPNAIFNRNFKPHSFWHESIGFGQMSMVAATYVIISIKYKKLNQCIEMSIVNCSFVIGNSMDFFVTLKKRILKPMIFMFLLMLSAICYQLLVIRKVDFSPKCELPIKQLFVTIVSVSYYNQFIFMLTYISLCDLLHQSLLMLYEKSQSNQDENPLISIFAVKNRHKWFIDCHKKMCESIQMMDDTLGVIMALWHLYQLVSLVFLLKELQEDGLNYDILIGIGVTFTLFIRLCMCASRVNAKILGSLRLMSSKECYDTNLMMDIDLTMYTHYVSLDPPGLTGWGLYVINRNFILTAFGSIISYVLVVYHLR